MVCLQRLWPSALIVRCRLQGRQCLFRHLDNRQCGEFGDQLGRQLAAGLAGQVLRSHRGKQRAGLHDGQELLGATGISSSSSRCRRLTVAVRATPSSSRRSASISKATE